MARVIFFASIREDLGCDMLDVDLSDDHTVSRLIADLIADRDSTWRQALTAENVRIAVNQELINGDVQLSNNDEIAFFPPVTGG